MYCIYQDSSGYLWLGTDKGLNRFDGFEFKNFNKDNGLPDNNITTLLADQQEKLWTGTASNGVSCFSIGDTINDSIRHWLPGSTVYSIKEDQDGKIWLGTSNGLYSYDGKVLRQLTAANGLPSNKILAIAFEKKDKIWLGTENGLCCYNTEFNTCSIFSTKDGLLDNAVSTLRYDSRGNLWIATKKGLNRLKGRKFISYTKEHGLCHNVVTALLEDQNSNLWIGTWNGVNIFSGEKLISYCNKNGLPNNIIYSITEDRENNLWFGTHGGLSCLISSNVKTYSRNDGLLNETVFAVLQDQKGKYWFGTTEGLSCYERGNFKNYTTRNGLIDNIINTLMEDRRGNIWIGTPHGLSIFSAGSFINYTEKDGLSSNILFDIVEARDGTIWLCTRKGLTCFINGKFTIPLFNLEQGGIYYIIEDIGGNIWFASRTRLYKYAGNRFTCISSMYGLPENEIYTIFEDSKNRIWISTEDGLICIAKGRFNHYSTKNSALPDKICYCILEDHQGNMWIGHPSGITCFNGREFKAYTSERMGLTGRSWLTGIRGNLGNLWFGTTHGVTTFLPPPVSPNTNPPPVYITGVKVMEKEISLARSKSFAYHQNIFRFNFAGISFAAPSGIHYKYRLENIDKDWQTTRDRSLFYPFLPPGSYTLKVKAINADGIESEKPAEYKFVIRSPFWQTWWFIFFIGVFLCGFLFLGLHWRVKRIREKAELKAKDVELEARNRQLVISQRMELMGTLAAGTVHDLKNLLAVIIGYSRLMGQKYREDNEDRQNIETIKDTAATAVQMVKQILSFARQKDSSHEHVDMGMELTEILDTLKITQPRNIHILRNLQAEPMLFPINPARFQQLVMNLCLNAFQAMPGGGQLGISLSYTTDNEIILEISDSGAGISKENFDKIFDPFFTTKKQSQGTGLGLFVVKEIVTEYNGKIDVHSEPGKGTTFVIRFPLIIN